MTAFLLSDIINKNMETIYTVYGILLLLFFFLLGNICFVQRSVRQTKEAWAEMEEEFKKRIKIAEEVISEIKRYASYEHELVQAVMEAKHRAEGAKTYEEKKKAGGMLSAVLKSVFKVSTKYADLKASQRMLELKEELQALEDGFSSAKDFYAEFRQAATSFFKKKKWEEVLSFFKRDKSEEVVDEKPKRGKVRNSKNKKKKTI